MITKELIENIVRQIIRHTDIFLVETKVKKDKIDILADKETGISIEECADISRKLRRELAEQLDDYYLTVSSPGLTQPFKVKEQYIKNKGKQIELILKNGENYTGKLIKTEDKYITIETTIKINKKEKKISTKNINFDEIKKAKLVISF